MHRAARSKAIATGTLVLAGGLALVMGPTSPLEAQLVPSLVPTPLAPRVTLERILAPGAVDRFLVELVAGDFASVAIEQRGANVAARLAHEDGTVLLTLDAMDDEYRPETLAAIAQTGGRHIVEVTGATATAQGAYRIRLDTLRPSVADDSARVDAERTFARGRAERNPNQAASWPVALQTFQVARNHFDALGDVPGVMKATLEIGITENYLGQPQALDTGREAARLAREVDEPAAVARALRLVGNILVARGDYDAAIEALDEATAAASAIGHRNSESRGLNDAAIAYRRRGNLEHAIDRYERALALARATGDGPMEGNVLNNLGVAYRNLGDLERAEDLYKRALAHRRAAGDTRSQFSPLLNLSNIRRKAGDHAMALQLAGEALAISRVIGDRDWEAQALNIVGRAEQARQDGAAALDRHREALARARDAGSLDEQSAALTGIGRALRSLGRHDEALAALQEALGYTRRMRFAFGEREDLGELALVERDRGNLAAAADYLERSLAIDESLRSGITSPELRTSFVAADRDRYELYLDVLHRRHLADPDGGHEATALHVSERARARVLLDSLLNGGVDLREGVPPALLQRERALQRQVNQASERLSAALASGKQPSADQLLESLEQLTAEQARVRAEMRRQTPRYAELTEPQPLSARRIQDEVLDADTVLLEFAFGDERSWLWTVTRGTVDLHTLPPREAIERAALRWREGVTARHPRQGESPAAYRRRVAEADAVRDRDGRALAAMLLGDIAGRLRDEWRGRRLAVVTAGVLDTLPFGALPLPQPGEAAIGTSTRAATPVTPLVARHEVVHLPSASVIAALRREARGTRPSKTVAILADPVFDRADPRVGASTAPGNRSALPDGPSVVLSRAALGRTKVTRLPFSREEADAIAGLVPADRVLKATGFDATRDTALGTALRDYRIVHFATHGVFDTERPALSGLVFSLVDRRGAYRDGFVRLGDIYNLRLDAELVVLSACETALGEQVHGEGLIGLARAFMYAGAPRVVASLWAVDDLATAELMTRFYRGMLQRSLRPAAALRAAQREMQADPRWSHPYYWAGFTLVGDWR